MPFMTLVVRSDSDPTRLTASLRNAVLEVDPEQPLHGVMTMDDVLAQSVGYRRFNMLLLGIFGSAALIMAAVGLYGVLSFSVAQRTREIGVRKALGAQSLSLILHVVREGFGLVVIGLAIGVAGGMALTQLISSHVYGVSVMDPVSYGIGIVLLAATGLFACWLPALRAARVNPIIALRAE